MGRTAPAHLFALVACASIQGTYAAKKKAMDDASKVPLPFHSFAKPMIYKDLLDDWTVSGASIFERDRLLMHPAVPERMGFLWNKFPVMTENFEVILHFRFEGEQTPTNFAYDQTLSFWYVEENVSSGYDESAMAKAPSWTQAMVDAGLTLGASAAKFKGIGAVMSVSDAEKKQRPVVSFISNDGTKTMSFGSDVPASNAKAINFRNTLNSAQLKMRISPEFAEAHFKESPSLSWNELLRIDRTVTDLPIPKSGYIGVTAWSGTSPGAQSDLISVTQIDVNNFDDTSIGEDMKDVSTKIQEAYREMLTDENRHFVDQKSQREHLQRLSTMLNDHFDEVGPADGKLFADVQDIDNRMSRLDEDCRTLSTEFSILVNPAGGAGAGSVKDHVVGLRELLSKDHADHTMKISTVSKSVQEVKEKRVGSPEAFKSIRVHAKTLEKTVESRSTQMSGLLFCLIACVLIIGALMFQRMRYYEKKHFL